MNICVPLIVLSYPAARIWQKGQGMRRTMVKASVVTALNLLFSALIGTALLAITYQLTHDPIARSEEKEKLKLVTQIVPPDTYDNDIIKDTAELVPDELLGNDGTTARLPRPPEEPAVDSSAAGCRAGRLGGRSV